MTARKQLDIYIDESGNFSAWSNENQFYSIALVLVDNEDEKLAKIALVCAAKATLAAGLGLLGIKAPEKM